MEINKIKIQNEKNLIILLDILKEKINKYNPTIYKKSKTYSFYLSQTLIDIHNSSGKQLIIDKKLICRLYSHENMLSAIDHFDSVFNCVTKLFTAQQKQDALKIQFIQELEINNNITQAIDKLKMCAKHNKSKE